MRYANLKIKRTLFFPEKGTQKHGVFPYSNTSETANSDWSKFRTNLYFNLIYVNLCFIVDLADLEVQLT